MNSSPPSKKQSCLQPISVAYLQINPKKMNDDGRGKKHVRFSEYSSLTQFPEPLREERQNKWSSIEDYATFKNKMSKSAVELRSAGKDSNIERLAYHAAIKSPKLVAAEVSLPEEARGIEHLISVPCLNLILHRRKRAVLAVLEEQAMQRELGVVYAARLAQISKKSTHWSRVWAFEVANVEDEK